ncbi:uncharacterized protein NECHADRAFT_78141 [Fusarium vanettenii 77-13-4]|uniref:Uncharacterized protein n=1 Tax=Fusarium vanettenii (strain ATCC MYA-4622 / CBS 123669 / FGSC 9596 / NRRL 45880 / 77-13-4) TaxID=660122 RepID=C7YN85_FUSV7|nr:uncharacterized protein NECHADRAFT_78141 [Fusarium vanettenii 77-13-4]EEU47078.1 predicted protein [Fusarium vanettenii 77-13-4]
MARLEDDDKHPLWKDFLQIVKLLIAPFNPIMEFTRKAGPNGTANGMFLCLVVAFWLGMSIFFYYKGIVGEPALVWISFLCFLVAVFWMIVIRIAIEMRQDFELHGWPNSDEYVRLMQGIWRNFTLLIRLLSGPYALILAEERKGIFDTVYHLAMCLCITIPYAGCPFFFVRAFLDTPLTEFKKDHWWSFFFCCFAASVFYLLVVVTTGRPGHRLRRYFIAVVRSITAPCSLLIVKAGESGIALTVYAIFSCLLVTYLLTLSSWFIYLALLDHSLDRICFWRASVVSLFAAGSIYILTLTVVFGSTMKDRHREKLLVASLLALLGIQYGSTSQGNGPEPQTASSPVPSEAAMDATSQPNPTADPLASAHDNQFPRG